MKKVVLFLATVLMASSASARLIGSVDRTPTEKSMAGFEIQLLQQEVAQNLVNGYVFTTLYGRATGDFRLELEKVIALPHPETPGIPVPMYRVGLKAMHLGANKSADLYAVLAEDYTPKRIAEGVEIGYTTASCPSRTQCVLNDDIGHFDLFEAQSYFFGPMENPFYTELTPGPNKLMPIEHQGQVLKANGELTEDFIATVIDRTFATAPSELQFMETKSTGPNRDLSYDEHRELAYPALAQSFGQQPIENRLIESMVTNIQTRNEELYRKGDSSGGCNYFCAPSGPPVRAHLRGDVKF